MVQSRTNLEDRENKIFLIKNYMIYIYKKKTLGSIFLFFKLSQILEIYHFIFFSTIRLVEDNERIEQETTQMYKYKKKEGPLL